MRHADHILLFVLLLLLLTAGIVYVARRTALAFGVSYTITTSLFIFLFISVIAILSSNIYVKGTTPLTHVLTIYGCYMGGFLLYLLLTTLFIHLLAVILRIPPLWQGVTTYSVTIFLYLYSIVATAHVTTPQVSLHLHGLQGQVRIAHLSDIHLGHFRGKEWLAGIVSRVNAQKPDIVVITGDIYESFYNLSADVVSPLNEIEAPIYYVTGNHDGYVNIPRIKSMLQECGVTVLDDSVAQCKGIQLVGVAFNSDPDSLLRDMDIESGTSSVMLYHYPKGVEAAHNAGISLVLSGHTHAGQFFPLTLINHFAFRYNSGLHRYPEDDERCTYIYTSDGIGTTGPPLRLGSFAQIPIITLNP